MMRRSVSRRLCTLVALVPVSIVAVACGGSNGSRFLGQTDASTDGAPGGPIDVGGDDASVGSLGDGGGASGACVPKTCAQLGYTCGMNGDGCGGMLNCGTCSPPAYCGGGGYSQCGGSTGTEPDGSPVIPPCTPETCQSANINCGQTGDGCGGVLSCGSCTSPEYCGGGGFNKCGGNNGTTADGGFPCTPTTCAAHGYNCGVTADGCGGILQCGSCTSPQYCGGGGFDKCGGNNGTTADGGPACTPETCASLHYNCGAAGDGCGGLLQCGTCTAPQYCGGGGFDKCGGNTGMTPDGGPACTPETCASLHYNCGAAGDGCGGLLQCGSCASPQYCGGGGFDVCGPTSIATCDSGTTSLTGYVYDPANNLPIYNALVFVPVGSVPTPQTGVSPATCGCTAPPALASATTDVTGKFTLTNVPSGNNVTVVVQLGKWQRTFTESVTACTANTLTAHLTLPSKSSQGHIPLFAIDTGAVDTMECVLLKMGIDPSEFVNPAIANGVPTAAGRVHLYEGSNQAGGAVINGNTPTEAALTESSSVLNSYDVALFPCQGGEALYNATNGFPNSLGNVLSFANNGGRVFATHFSYVWLFQNGSFANTANWTVNKGSYNPTFTGNIDQTFGRGQALATWLAEAPVNASTTPGQIPVNVVRNDFSSVHAPAQQWVYTTNPPDQGLASMDIHYTFDTPFVSGGADGTCGRVVFSDFHVEDASNNMSTGVDFPTECQVNGSVPAMTAQEKLLEFMLFDLTSCVSAPACTPTTCAAQNINCGPAGDGCGGQLNCGTCVAPQTCGGAGVPGQCGSVDAAACVPTTCAAQHIGCGPAGDGCGGQLNCGPCVAGQTCGGGGIPGQCGSPEAGACVPSTCAAQHIGCGPAGDGCGGQLDCGPCVAGQTCGGGGIAGQCGSTDGGTCVPTTCAAQHINCGPAGDGCGNLLQCGPCAPGLTCGGGGTPGQCGAPEAGACVPISCATQHINCGPTGDGCGNLLQCGNCSPPQTCGGGGTPGQCGGGVQ